MGVANTGRWAILERWSGTAFLVGGGFLLAYTMLIGVETFANVSTPGWLGGLVSGLGLVDPLVGLLGFYPRLVGRVPRLARAGATVVASAAVAVFVTTAWGVSTELVAGTAGVDIPAPSGGVIVISLGLVALGVLLVSTATLWTGTPSRAVGGILLAVVGVNLAYFVAVAVYGAARPDWLNVAITGAHPVLFLAIGYLLPTTALPSASGVQASDSTAR